jgi:hypothetical protein
VILEWVRALHDYAQFLASEARACIAESDKARSNGDLDSARALLDDGRDFLDEADRALDAGLGLVAAAGVL